MKAAIVLAGLLLSTPLFGQGARLQIQLDHLATKAQSVVNINLDGAMLEAGRQLLSAQKDADPGVKQLIEKLTGVYVRVFEFAQPGAYTPADVEAVRSQLSGSGWVHFVDVKEKTETVTISSYLEGGKVAGLAVLAAEPKELTVVNIVGPIDWSQIGKLGGLMGIPDIKSPMQPTPPKPKPADQPQK